MFGIGKAVSAMGGGLSGAASGGGLFGALMKKAIPEVGAQGAPPPQAQGQPPPFSGGPPAPFQGTGWGGGAISNMMSKLPQSPGQGIFSQPFQKQGKTSSQPPVQGGAHQAGPPQGPPQPMPPSPVPNIPAHVPPQAQRWQNGQAIQQAYANNWEPNPVLLRAELGK